MVLQHRKVRNGSRSADEAAETSVGGASVGDDVIETLALQLLVAQKDASTTATAMAQRPNRKKRIIAVRSEHRVSHAADGGDDGVL